MTHGQRIQALEAQVATLLQQIRELEGIVDLTIRAGEEVCVVLGEMLLASVETDEVRH